MESAVQSPWKSVIVRPDPSWRMALAHATRRLFATTFQVGNHSVIPFTTYSESVLMTISVFATSTQNAPLITKPQVIDVDSKSNRPIAALDNRDWEVVEGFVYPNNDTGV